MEICQEMPRNFLPRIFLRRNVLPRNFLARNFLARNFLARNFLPRNAKKFFSNGDFPRNLKSGRHPNHRLLTITYCSVLIVGKLKILPYLTAICYVTVLENVHRRLRFVVYM